MPHPASGAQRASTRSLGPLSRIIIALALASAAPFAPFAFQNVQAGAACGTNWDSRTDPPDTIKVYREAKDRVETVDFKTYVEVVMTAEWPYWLPQTMLEVGATLAKQFTWYHALAGHHRSSYVTKSGDCYDVVDTHMDQIYKPETADVRDAQVQAVDATWGLSLRQNGGFFLTQYRSGYDVGCGDDANGQILYAHSATDCAQNGRDRDRIFHIYYGDSVDLVWSSKTGSGRGDGTPPKVSKPTVDLRAGATLDGKIATVSWSGSDASGIRGYELQKRTDGGGWHEVALPKATATHADVSLAGGHSYDLRVRAQDKSGLWSDYAMISAGRVQVVEGGGVTLTDGKWLVDKDRSASGGATRYTRTDGARASLTFTGSAIAFVTTLGPDRGTVDIIIDGQKVATVDLSAARLKPQAVAWSKTWATSAKRTIQIVVHGTARVDVDALVILK